MEVIEINHDGGGKREKGSKGSHISKSRRERIRTGYATKTDYIKQSQSDRKKNGKKNSKKASKKDIDMMIKLKQYYFNTDNLPSKRGEKQLGRPVVKKAGSKKVGSKKVGSKKVGSKKVGSKKVGSKKAGSKK